MLCAVGVCAASINDWWGLYYDDLLAQPWWAIAELGLPSEDGVRCQWIWHLPTACDFRRLLHPLACCLASSDQSNRWQQFVRGRRGRVKFLSSLLVFHGNGSKCNLVIQRLTTHKLDLFPRTCWPRLIFAKILQGITNNFVSITHLQEILLTIKHR